MRTGHKFIFLAMLLLSLGWAPDAARAQVGARNSEVIVIDAGAPVHPFPHFWEEMFGSGRAVLGLRESYRNDLRSVKQITDFHYVRFHAIFQDEVGLYDEDEHGHPVYNFSYVDQIYDGLLANGVRPFVELSFMPKKLAADKNALHAFWYKQNISPPKDYGKWDEMIRAFTRHAMARRKSRNGISRYGTNRTSISGRENRNSRLTSNCTTIRRGRLSRWRRGCGWGGPRPRRRPGRMCLSGIARRRTFRSTLCHRMCMGTTKRKMCSGRAKRFRATGWCAAP